MKTFAILFTLFFSFWASAANKVDYKKIFGERDGCFLILDKRTGVLVDEYNSTRCDIRFSPYSSFKIAAALIAFETGVFKDEKQLIRWDGVKRGRKEIDQDLTPITFMSTSAKWVTEWIMTKVGEKKIAAFLKSFSYGNQDFSGGLKDAWVSSSLKISAREQVSFLSKFWSDELGLSSLTNEKAKNIFFVKKFGGNTELYGKTGTGCLEGNKCLSQPDKMIGWFVGILKNDKDIFVFAGNASDLKPHGPPAGPRMREATEAILKQMGLVNNQ